MTSPTLLAVSHGTSDPDGARAVDRLIAAVTARCAPDVTVHGAFVDVQEPEVAARAARIDGPIVVVPLLLSQGVHVHQDLQGLTEQHPNLTVARPLGPDPRLAEVLAERLNATAHSPTATVVLAVAGSRDDRSVTDAETMASLLATTLDRPVEVAYLAARHPDLPTVLARHPLAVVVPYLLAPGFFFDLTRACAGHHPVASPLLMPDAAPPAALVDIIVDRFHAADRDS